MKKYLHYEPFVVEKCPNDLPELTHKDLRGLSEEQRKRLHVSLLSVHRYFSAALKIEKQIPKNEDLKRLLESLQKKVEEIDNQIGDGITLRSLLIDDDSCREEDNAVETFCRVLPVVKFTIEKSIKNKTYAQKSTETAELFRGLAYQTREILMQMNLRTTESLNGIWSKSILLILRANGVKRTAVNVKNDIVAVNKRCKTTT